MNLFGFDSKSKQITIGNDFWMFIATWLPLTLMTGAIYLLVVLWSWREKSKKRRGSLLGVCSEKGALMSS